MCSDWQIFPLSPGIDVDDVVVGEPFTLKVCVRAGSQSQLPPSTPPPLAEVEWKLPHVSDTLTPVLTRDVHMDGGFDDSPEELRSLMRSHHSYTHSSIHSSTSLRHPPSTAMQPPPTSPPSYQKPTRASSQSHIRSTTGIKFSYTPGDTVDDGMDELDSLQSQLSLRPPPLPPG